jgi:hypothetical protein
MLWAALDPPTLWVPFNLAISHNQKIGKDSSYVYTDPYPLVSRGTGQTTSYTGMTAVGKDGVLISYDYFNGSLGHHQAIFTVQVNVSKVVANAMRTPTLKTDGDEGPQPQSAAGAEQWTDDHTMTEYQRDLVRRAAARAAVASSAATPLLLAAFAEPRLRGNLSKCCPSVAGLTPEKLLARFEAEVAAAEVVHGFEASTATPTQAGCDVDLALLRNSSHLPNLWELIFDGQRQLLPLENWGGGPADAAEIAIGGEVIFILPCLFCMKIGENYCNEVPRAA